MPTEQEYKDAVNLLIQYAHDMNDRKAYSGDWREDVTEAKEVCKAWGFEAEYRFEDGKQYLYVGGVKRS